MSKRARSRSSAVQVPDSDTGLVIVMPGVWPPAQARPRGLWPRLTKRLQERWPAIRRALPRDLAILLLLFMVTRYVGLAWVMTDSVHKSAVLVLKGAAARPGELAVFGYTGSAIAGYHGSTWWSELLGHVGWKQASAGPAKGEGFVKYLVGVPGDRVEVEGRQIWLVTARGRINGGLCKTHSRAGVPLQPISPQVIPPGFVYMWAPHADALDSRYAVMGLVPVSAIRGRAVPLW
ncbi:S26 family signal peptidase [Ideonella sp. YS5]|uniref:S26 family signal peptidase n=1 Tax=Ideonella sp. YS5 TaxID=3453714 RepID=UPI003EE82626